MKALRLILMAAALAFVPAAASAQTPALNPCGTADTCVGSGDARDVFIVADGVKRIRISFDGTTFLPMVDATTSLGSSTQRFKDGYFSGDLTVGSCTGCGGVAGADTQVQFNDAGELGGDAGLTFNKTTDALVVSGSGTFNGSVLFGTNITTIAGGYIHNTLRSGFTSPVDGTFRIQNWNFDNYVDVLTAAWGTTLSAEAVSVANAATLTLGTATSGSCTVSYPGDVAIYLLRGTANATTLTSGSATFSVTKDNAATVNVYYDTTGYFLQNNTGGTLSFRVACIGG